MSPACWKGGNARLMGDNMGAGARYQASPSYKQRGQTDIARSGVCLSWRVGQWATRK